MKKISVVNSRIHGKGVFATHAISKGELVGFIKGPVIHKVNNSLRDTFSNPDWVGFKQNYWTDPLPPFKYLNHSCSANCGIKGTRSLYAIQAIKAGEEISIDYSTTELDENWYLECSCGSAKCRKEVRSIQSLSKSLFNRYDPYIPTYHRKFYLVHCI